MKVFAKVLGDASVLEIGLLLSRDMKTLNVSL